MQRKYGIKQEWFSEFFNTKTYAKNFDSNEADGWLGGWGLALKEYDILILSTLKWNEIQWNGMKWKILHYCGEGILLVYLQFYKLYISTES